MGGTKIIVVQLKEVIKSVVFALIGLILIFLLIYMFIPKGEKQDEGTGTSALYYPGTYSSEIILHNSPVVVEVTVTKDKIVSIQLNDMDETQAVFYPLFKPTLENLSSKIVKNQTLDILLSADNATTEEILITAIRGALDKAESKLHTENNKKSSSQ